VSTRGAPRRALVPGGGLTAAGGSGSGTATAEAGSGGVDDGARAAARGAGEPAGPGRAGRQLPDDRDWVGRYAAGESLASIGRGTGTWPPGVRDWLRRRGVEIRDPAAAARVRAVREGRSPEPRRRTLTLRDQTRGRAVLTLLAGHPGGLSTPQFAALNGEQPGQVVLARYGAVLRDAEAAGWVERTGKTPGRWGQAPAITWMITGPGRAALTAAQPPPAPVTQHAVTGPQPGRLPPPLPAGGQRGHSCQVCGCPPVPPDPAEPAGPGR
jgi:hypothetical protein